MDILKAKRITLEHTVNVRWPSDFYMHLILYLPPNFEIPKLDAKNIMENHNIDTILLIRLVGVVVTNSPLEV